MSDFYLWFAYLILGVLSCCYTYLYIELKEVKENAEKNEQET